MRFKNSLIYSIGLNLIITNSDQFIDKIIIMSEKIDLITEKKYLNTT